MEIYTIHYVTILYIYIYIYYIYVYVYIYTYKIEPSIWVYNIPTMDWFVWWHPETDPPNSTLLIGLEAWITMDQCLSKCLHPHITHPRRSQHASPQGLKDPRTQLNPKWWSSRFITGAYLTYHWNVIWISWSTTWSRKSEASGLCSILASYIFSR